MISFDISQRSIFELLNRAVFHLSRVGIDNPRLEAEIILSHVLRVERISLWLNGNSLVSKGNLNNFEKLIARRINREPVAYIVGIKEFWSIILEVDNRVLIPRPETEFLVRSVLPFLKDRTFSGSCKKILDVGTGSGAIILALASEVSVHDFYALDASPEAIKIARNNAFKNGLDVKFMVSCWLDALKDDEAIFDLIISNPPYIRTGDLEFLQPEIYQYEPSMALDGGPDGLSSLRIIIKDSAFCLCSGGLLALEIGYDQGKEIREIINSNGGFSKVKIIKDYSGFDRVVHAMKM